MSILSCENSTNISACSGSVSGSRSTEHSKARADRCRRVGRKQQVCWNEGGGGLQTRLWQAQLWRPGVKHSLRPLWERCERASHKRRLWQSESHRGEKGRRRRDTQVKKKWRWGEQASHCIQTTSKHMTASFVVCRCCCWRFPENWWHEI